MSDSGEAKMCEEELESQRAEEESQSQQRQVAEISNKSSEKVARTEDDEALPLACPICKTSFLDPAVTNCDHYFCKRYALKHHENDTNCFVCKKPTLGVFKPSVELKNKVATVLENAQHQLKSQPTEEESQSQHSERANKRKLDEDSEQVARAEDDDDALPLACPSCKLSFLDPACLDPVVTTCDHYFCNLCALKHHKNDATCFVCKKPTLGVFKPSVEIKNKIAKVRENLKPQGLYVS